VSRVVHDVVPLHPVHVVIPLLPFWQPLIPVYCLPSAAVKPQFTPAFAIGVLGLRVSGPLFGGVNVSMILVPPEAVPGFGAGIGLQRAHGCGPEQFTPELPSGGIGLGMNIGGSGVNDGGANAVVVAGG
jgi:hypothetical protein